MTDKSAPITLSQVAPELRESIKKIPRTPVSNAFGRWLIRTATKLLLREKSYPGVRLEKHMTQDGIPLRIYIPDTRTSNAALLWIHGGGLVVGSAVQDSAFCSETAHTLGITVISTEYRLAPEFPFPAALDDCYAAWNWLQESATHFNIDQHRVGVGGQSAGGGLAASLAQRLSDTSNVQPAAQWLFCPMLDDRTAATRELDKFKHLIWDNQQNRAGWRAYLGTEPGNEAVPDYAVPARRDDLHGLPSTWIGVGDIDLFFEENKAYADRLKAAGVNCTFEVVPGAPHGFEAVAGKTKLVQNYLLNARKWLHETLIHS